MKNDLMKNALLSQEKMIFLNYIKQIVQWIIIYK